MKWLRLRSRTPYSQAEVGEQIRQIGELHRVHAATDAIVIANEILKFMLDSNIHQLEGKE